MVRKVVKIEHVIKLVHPINSKYIFPIHFYREKKNFSNSKRSSNES